MFGVYFQKGLLFKVESWKRTWEERDNISNAQGDIVRWGEAAIISTFQSYSHLTEPQLRLCSHQNGWLLYLCEIVLMIDVGGSSTEGDNIHKQVGLGWMSYLSIVHWSSRRARQETIVCPCFYHVCSFSFYSKLPIWWTIIWQNHSQQQFITWDAFAHRIPSQQ